MMKNNQGKPTRLRILLVRKGLTQKDIAEMADVEMYQISNLCSGKNTNIHLDTAKKIAYCIGATLDEAFGDNDDDDM